MSYMKFYSYDADKRHMLIYSRDAKNEICVTVEGVDIYQSTAIGNALDRIYKDGVAAGKIEVINSVNHTVDNIAV